MNIADLIIQTLKAAGITHGFGVLDRLVAGLSDDEAQICRDAIHQTETDGVLFVAEPFHCAVARR